MAARFGRNKRRAARQALASANAAYAMANGLSKRLGESNRRMREEMDEARRVLGEYHVAFRPKTIRTEQKSADPDRPFFMEKWAPISNNYLLSDDSLTYAINEQLSLHVLAVKVAQNPAYADEVHIRVKFADQTVSYACTRSAIERFTVEDLSQTIGRQVGERLALALKEVA